MATPTVPNGDATPARKPVSVTLDDLRDGNVPFSKLEDAFGPSSLGIILVSNLPASFAGLRRRVLSYSSYLAALPPQERTKLENGAAKYLVGWSLGKETLKSNKPDTLKGSYYVNCAFYKDAALQGAPLEAPEGGQRYDDFPEYTAPNVWPAESVLPGFRAACEELCSLIIDVAVLVASACDRFAQANVQGYAPGYLQRVVTTSLTTKARLLHYFPAPADNDDDTAADDDDDWCATHLDHGCLTGLTSAMYVDETLHPPLLLDGGAAAPPQPLPELDAAPDDKAGLYIHSRDGAVTKVAIPRDCLAFQTGEALQLITQGKFRAVPHFVRGIQRKGSTAAVARNTLAVFTQPNLWEPVVAETTTFAQFARGVVARNYLPF